MNLNLQLYWNYFVALDHDLNTIARFIEVNESNFDTYSIELTRVLLAASSEVDVVAKLLCKVLDPSKKLNDINDYRDIITSKIPDMPSEKVFLPRFGLERQPWLDWDSGTNPDWWTGHNKVKHMRSDFFNKANLINTIDAVGGLLVLLYYLYSYALPPAGQPVARKSEVTRCFSPGSNVLRLSNAYYAKPIVVEG